MTDIGATLREARMRAQLDITEVERATKIRPKYIRALEDEEWAVLPGPTFVKSFLRTYGDYLGLDSRLLVDEYKRRYERPSAADMPAISAPLGTPRGSGRPQRSWRPVVIGLLILGILGAFYALGQWDTSGDEGNGGAAPPTTTEERPTRREAPRERRRARRPEKAAGTPRRARVRFTAVGEVYVCVENAAGEVLIPGVTLAPGEQSEPVAGRRLLVALGNSGVEMTVNGRRRPVTASTEAIGYEVTARGRRDLTGPLPDCS